MELAHCGCQSPPAAMSRHAGAHNLRHVPGTWVVHAHFRVHRLHFRGACGGDAVEHPRHALFRGHNLKFALSFGSYEYFALVIFALTRIISISKKSILKGVMAACVGMFMSSIGLSNVDTIARFTFNFLTLQSGIDVMPVLIGMYAISQIREFLGTAKSFKNHKKNVFRSAVIGIAIGIAIGILPGEGPGLSNIVAYTHALTVGSRGIDKLREMTREIVPAMGSHAPDMNALRIMRIPNTLHLGHVMVSEAMLGEALARSNTRLVRPPEPMRFGADGTIDPIPACRGHE